MPKTLTAQFLKNPPETFHLDAALRGYGVLKARPRRLRVADGLRLGKDFDIDYTELTRCAQLAKAYPIVGRGRELRFNLTWKRCHI